jgi:hypothetical protein
MDGAVELSVVEARIRDSRFWKTFGVETKSFLVCGSANKEPKVGCSSARSPANAFRSSTVVAAVAENVVVVIGDDLICCWWVVGGANWELVEAPLCSDVSI